jgi:P-type Ca2+ transporter type 2C
VIDAHRLCVNEAPLTGESEPQRKWPQPLPHDRPLSERTSILFAGTAVVSGRGRAVVVATGARTEMARVRSLIEQSRAPVAPLERRMDALGRQATWVSVGAALAGLARGHPLGAVMRSGIALGVAAIPEGLPVVVTAALVRSMRRMRERGMVVRRMSSVETLGGVTVVCADKTGTLTQNDMRLEVLQILVRGGLPRAPRAEERPLRKDARRRRRPSPRRHDPSAAAGDPSRPAADADIPSGLRRGAGLSATREADRRRHRRDRRPW